MNEKVCVTTYVWGDNYQLYIPIAVFSMKKMYPEYDIIIFLHSSLNPELKKILIQLDLFDKIVIKENTFANCPNMNKYKAKAFRWVIWDELFFNYDYLYTIDIDMFYIKEPLPLHKQHIYHMENVTKLPFDNMRRFQKRNALTLKEKIVSSLACSKNFGVFKAIKHYKYIYNDINKLSGLHFVDIKKYYYIVNKEVLKANEKKIFDGTFLIDSPVLSDECFLYKMLKNVNINVDILDQQDFGPGFKHMDFNNYNKPLFRPVHGIHLGDFRNDTHIKKENDNLVCYDYYKNYFIDFLLNDNDFTKFLSLINNQSKLYFKRYFDYAVIDLANYSNIKIILDEII
ncbi:MAG: hypothetical protein PHR45_05605 [Muribaculaceae bacterium]|nr:hypothetical protein [Muribaculaceae bacterium]